MKRLASLLFVLPTLLLACGGPAAPKPQPGPGPGPNPGPINSVARVEINSASLVFENGKAGQQIIAQAFDAKGNVVNTPISYQSSKPDVIAVDASGQAAAKSVGSSQIVAVAGGVRSSPAIAASAILADNVVRIPDSKVVGAPQFAEGVTPFSVGSTYTVVLKEVSPTAGKLWFSKAPNGMTVQGKVLSSRPVDSGTEVTLEIVPISDVFKDMSISEDIAVKAEEVEFGAATKAAYTITRQADDTFVFTPKDTNTLAGNLAPLSFNVGPFSCDGSLPDAAFNLGTPSFSLNPGSPQWNFIWQTPLPAIPFITDGRAGRLRVLFTATPTLTVRSGNHSITGNFNNQSVTCRYRDDVRVGFSAFGLGFAARMKPGVTLGGSFGAGTRTLSAVGSVSSNIRVGFDCRAPSGCTTLSQGSLGTVRGAVSFGGTGDLAGTLRDFKAGVFMDAGVEVQTPIKTFDLIRFTEGYRINTDFAPLATQISSGNPSDYKMGLYAKVDPFALIKDLVKFAIGVNVGGLPDINLEEQTLQSPLIKSLNLNAAKTQVTVNMDASRLNFYTLVAPFSLGYNVKKVRLIEKSAGGTLTTLADVTPSSGAASVTLNIPASADLERLYITLIPNVLDQLPVGTVKVTGK
ncbi:hypothetical protein FNU79_05845 [Deinococcus detaillensis]|uniref:BIG2 domain-containing protein n=1 Tax=Deinococcus detaillensis TaxID=2592048 RepID=A0A553V2K4_9DEIO|nr:hypothetical protein [Deinococcus detaillensis]TSA86717.1 hypothetical protein FNU79_05845 [Deinococcus detaillensis]